MTYTDLNSDRVSIELNGFAAICAQHEMDHLAGRVIFDQLDADHRSVLEAEYLGSLS